MVTITETNTANNTSSATLVVGAAPGSTLVSTASALQQALNDGVMDITLTAAVNAPSGGINVPRTSTTRILRCSGSGILNRGSPTGHVLRSDGTSGTGRLHLIGFRVDGGWRTNPHEEPNDLSSNYFFPNMAFVRFENCVTCYSLRTGYMVAGTNTVEIINSTLFACPRDHAWADRVRDLLVQGCLIQHCGDDSLGTHQLAGQGLITQSIRFIDNTVRDSLGGKLHCGAADGSYNGKTSQILYDGNVFEACGLYGVHGHQPPPEQNHNISQPHNIIINNNRFENLRATAPVSPGQTIGVAVRMSFPDFSYDSSMRITNNQFVRNASAQGQTLGAVYSWPVPPNVPGAATYQGQFFTKTGFSSSQTFNLAGQATLFQGSNSGSVTHFGNTYAGSWSSQIS